MAAKKNQKRRNTSNKRIKKSNPLTKEITFLVLLVFAILSLLSLFDMCGIVGEALSILLFGLFGAMAYAFPIYLIVATGLYIANSTNTRLKNKVWFSIGGFVCLCAIFQWVVNDPNVNDSARTIWDVYKVCAANHGGGGLLGGLLAFGLARALGRAGSFIVIIALLLLFFMLLSGKMVFASLQQLYREHEEADFIDYRDEVSSQRQMNTYKFANDKKADKKVDKKTEKKGEQKDRKKVQGTLEEIHIIRSAEEIPSTSGEKASTLYEEELTQKFGNNKRKTSELKETVENSEPEYSKQEKVTITKEDEKELAKVQQQLDDATTKEVPYQFPPLDLLSVAKGNRRGMDNNELRATAMKLQNTLQSFGVRVKMGDISLGPSVTRYELIPEQGVKVSKITSLSDDIKLSLAASDIRIEAPIPGKAAVGIEVPNPSRQTITLRELLESNEFSKAKSKVTFAVGKDISGKTIVTDIAKMPHLLIAGATGSGKSVLINTLIMSIIYKANPNDVKLIMVDPKMVELTAYEDIPHLMIPVVKDPKKASAALSWAVVEMTGRYQKFADVGVRDIKSYNAKISKMKHTNNTEYQKMPQIVIIVDEFADLMMVAPGEVEDSVCRLAQLARAAGIHLVLATQRPSVNVITGLIKANIPSRIALSVSSQVDSRTIIDSAGAEKLLGNGDMLFAPQNLPKPIRVQGAFVSDEERDSVVHFLKSNAGGPAYNEEVTKHIDTAPVPGAKNATGNVTGGGNLEQDELFVEAAKFIIEKDKASIGLLQRMFRIGFNRAARIMDQLADAGVVGPEEGTKARQILMSKEQFENYLEENGV